jgi:hypothetical protein
LINEIEYKVVKAIFSVKKIMQIEVQDFSNGNLQIGAQPNPLQRGNTNPLFVNPNLGNS